MLETLKPPDGRGLQPLVSDKKWIGDKITQKVLIVNACSSLTLK